jgi:hypothetical protein
MEVDILDFVEECRHLAKQALGKHAGEPASGGFARWKHVVIHCFRREEGHSFRETENRLEYMTALQEVLDLEEGEALTSPHSTSRSIGSKCGSGGRCCAFQRSNTRNLVTSPSTARSSTVATPQRTTVRGLIGR